MAHDDDDEGVRDRACLGLGLFTDIDTADIRASLHRAVHGHADSDEAADEALVSLSGRGDTTIPPTLLRRLDPAANPRPLVVRAALELAHAKTYAALRDLRSSGWHDVAHPTLLVEAIAACAPG